MASAGHIRGSRWRSARWTLLAGLALVLGSFASAGAARAGSMSQSQELARVAERIDLALGVGAGLPSPGQRVAAPAATRPVESGQPFEQQPLFAQDNPAEQAGGGRGGP